MNSQADNVFQGNRDTSPTAESVLQNLSKDQRIRFYSGLCEYVRWILKRQEHDKDLMQLEKTITYLENLFKGQVKAGELSEDEANNRKSHHIWYVACHETKNAPGRIALWEPEIMMLPSEKYDEAFKQRKESIKRELLDKLRQCIDLDEV